MVSPSGKVYFGNFFTEDVDGDGVLDAGENCHDRGAPNTLDEEIWSIETNACGAIAGTRRDTGNPVEAIFLSRPRGDGARWDQSGDWSLKVIYRTGTGSQRYAVSCSGPIATHSSVRFEKDAYVCADQVRVTVVEASDPLDPGVTAVEVASRTTVQVVDGKRIGAGQRNRADLHRQRAPLRERSDLRHGRDRLRPGERRARRASRGPPARASTPTRAAVAPDPGKLRLRGGTGGLPGARRARRRGLGHVRQGRRDPGQGRLRARRTQPLHLRLPRQVHGRRRVDQLPGGLRVAGDRRPSRLRGQPALRARRRGQPRGLPAGAARPVPTPIA